MEKNEWLAERFEANRNHLRGVAYRMLGSLSEADDAVQEAWLRLSRSDTSGIENLAGWLTTVVARVCLNMLHSREARREEPLGGVHVPDPIISREDGSDPEQEALLADAIGLALLIVLDTLTPAERIAFVLLDMFAVPFEEIAPIVRRSPTGHGSSQLAPAAGCSEHQPFPTPTSPNSESSSTPSSPPHATVTSTRCSRSSPPRSCSEPTTAPWPAPARSAVHRLSPGARSPTHGTRASHDQRS